MNNMQEGMRRFFQPSLDRLSNNSINTDSGLVLVALAIYFVAEAVYHSAELISKSIREGK